MENLFLTILRMSVTAAVVILVVLLARLLLRRAPKIFSYALWAVVLFRLLCPVSISSSLSLLPAVQTQSAGEAKTSVHIYTGIAAMNSQVNDYLDGHPYPVEFTPSEREGDIGAVYLDGVGRMVGAAAPGWAAVACPVWLAGAVLLLGYSLISLLVLRRRLVGSMPLEGEKNVRLADHIPSPFVLGVFRPKIYLPSGLPEGERDYILLHERTHIRRCDHIFRALAWLALSIHWFNPLVWLAFHLAGKDMEMSCDEAVLRKMGRDVRADYSSSLLRLSTGKRLPAGPLAFGDGDPQSRIKNVLRWKKPALWVVVAALIAVVCAGVALATNPGHFSGPGKPVDFVYHEPGPAERWVDMTDYPPDEPWPESVELQMPEYPGITFRWTREMVTAAIEDGGSSLPEGLPVTEDGQSILFFGKTIWSVYLCDLNGDGLRDMCFTADFGEERGDRRVLGCYYGYNTFSFGYMDSAYAHFLRLEGDRLWVEERDYASGAVIRSGPLVMTESGLDISGRQDPAGGAPSEAATASPPIAELTLSLDQSEEGRPYVRMEGSVGDVVLPRGAFWHPEPSAFEAFPDGYLTMVYPGFTDGIEGHVEAGWTDGSRTSVTLSTRMTAMLSSLSYAGYWDVTVDLESGTVTKMAGHPFREGGEVRYYPESISDGEAVKAARVAAKLLTAAEDYYANAQHGGLSPAYTLDEGDGSGDVRINGLGGGYASWSADTSPSGGNLYFTGIPASCCPRLAGRVIEGSAIWTDETHTAVSVVMNVNDDRVVSGTVSGFYIHFIVDLTDMAVIRSEFGSEIEGETLELDGQEMADIAGVLAQALEGAEDYYNNSAT